MTAAAPAGNAARRAGRDPFEPALARRKLTGTIFYGACLAAIGILLLALVILLSTSCRAACRGSISSS